MIKRERLRRWAKSRFWLQERFNEFFNWCIEKRLPFTAAIILVTALFVFFSFLKQLFLITLFIALGAASLLYNRFIKTSLGIEFITLGVVIIGRLYGAWAAMIVGFVSLFLAELFTGALQHKTAVSFVGILIMGFLTQFFQNASITAEGIILTIIYNAIIIPGYLLLGSNPLRSVLFLVTNIAFNIWVFTTIAPSLLRILT